jgi:hypothetical protein
LTNRREHAQRSEKWTELAPSRRRGDYNNRPDSGGFRRSLGPGCLRRRDDNNFVDYDDFNDKSDGLQLLRRSGRDGAEPLRMGGERELPVGVKSPFVRT